MTFNIASLLPDINPLDLRPKIKNKRQYALSLFVERLNQERGNLKPLSPTFIAFKLSHLDVEDLHYFYKQCEQANCGFSKAWWGSLKTDRKPVEKKWLTKKWKKC